MADSVHSLASRQDVPDPLGHAAATLDPKRALDPCCAWPFGDGRCVLSWLTFPTLWCALCRTNTCQFVQGKELDLQSSIMRRFVVLAALPFLASAFLPAQQLSSKLPFRSAAHLIIPCTQSHGSIGGSWAGSK